MANKITIRKQSLKALDKCDEIQGHIKDGAASAITEIDLSHNQLTSLSGLKPFDQLNTLIFDYNLLKGLNSLPEFKSLKVISLSYNQIADQESVLRIL